MAKKVKKTKKFKSPNPDHETDIAEAMESVTLRDAEGNLIVIDDKPVDSDWWDNFFDEEPIEIDVTDSPGAEGPKPDDAKR